MSHLTEQEAALLELASKATKGPWVLYGSFGSIVDDERHHIASVTPFGIGEEEANWNRIFIAAARTAVPELLAEVERLRGENARLRKALEYYADFNENTNREMLYTYFDYYDARLVGDFGAVALSALLNGWVGDMNPSFAEEFPWVAVPAQHFGETWDARDRYFKRGKFADQPTASQDGKDGKE